MSSRSGYIAVISAVIITTIVIVIALVFSSGNFLGRFDTLGFETKDAARKVAEGCLEHAKLQLALGSYEGNETISVGTEACDILPIEISGFDKIIKATATVMERTANLELTVDGATLENISLEEVGVF
jgi:hypothetical protein